MSFAIVLLNDTRNFAGTERHLVDLEQSLRAVAPRVVTFCPSDSTVARNIVQQGGEVRHCEPLSVRGITRLASTFRQGNVVVHAHNGRCVLAAVAAKRMARRGAVVMTHHFITPAHVTRTGLAGAASTLVHARVRGGIDHSVAISTAVQDAVAARGDAPRQRLSRVLHGVSLPAGQRIDRCDVRREFGLGVDAQLVVCAARLEAEKRIDVLVDAMAQVVRSHPKACCIIAGEGRCREILRQRIDRAALGDRVKLVGFRQDVRRLMGAADVFVLPADAEPFGLVLLEAMGVGVPVIASDAGGPREIVVPGETGWLVPPNDPPALARAIADALADPARSKRYGEAGRERLSRHFAVERMARETIAVYERALEHARFKR